MPETRIALLEDRGVVAVTGPDAAKLLQGLISNDLDRLKKVGDALHAGLLTPQGKILFAFFVVRTADGYLLETDSGQVAGLAKRLGFYKLRASVSIENLGPTRAWAVWSTGERTIVGNDGSLPTGPETPIARFRDPRHPELGWRWLVGHADSVKLLTIEKARGRGVVGGGYAAHRISLGVPEAGLDYQLGDTFPHEANFDLCHGVDFDKGCFVGQEVVARMQHKTVVRKRVVKVSGDAALPADHPDITAGAATIGRLGSAEERNGLALIRVDRAIEAIDKGEPVRAGGVTLTVDEATLAAYRVAAAAKAGAS